MHKIRTTKIPNRSILASTSLSGVVDVTSKKRCTTQSLRASRISAAITISQATNVTIPFELAGYEQLVL